MNKFQAYQTVKIVDKDYERFGQVGTYVGPGAEAGEVSVKFEGATPDAPQETDTFPADAVESI
jgi:hypothetical protein